MLSTTFCRIQIDPAQVLERKLTEAKGIMQSLAIPSGRRGVDKIERDQVHHT